MVFTLLFVTVAYADVNTAKSNNEALLDKSVNADGSPNMTPITVTDTSNLSKENKIDKLVKMGVDREKAATLPDRLVNELIKDDGEIISIEVKKSKVENTKQITDKENQSAVTNNFAIMATMPEDEIALYNVVQRIYEKTGYDNFKFTSYADWYILPTWTLVDAIATAWSDNFTLYYDSGTYTAIDSNFNEKSWALSRNDVQNEIGVARDVDLLYGYTNHSVIEVAKVYAINATGTANASTQYAHEEIGIGNITVGFSVSGDTPTVGFTATPGSFLEEAVPAYSAFNY